MPSSSQALADGSGLPVVADWQSWKDWPMEVEVDGGEALVFPRPAE